MSVLVHFRQQRLDWEKNRNLTLLRKSPECAKFQGNPLQEKSKVDKNIYQNWVTPGDFCKSDNLLIWLSIKPLLSKMQRDSTFPYYEPCSFPLHRFDLHSFKQCITTTNKKYIDKKLVKTSFWKKSSNYVQQKVFKLSYYKQLFKIIFKKTLLITFQKCFFSIKLL